jgi:hypothetical protein
MPRSKRYATLGIQTNPVFSTSRELPAIIGGAGDERKSLRASG